MTFAAEEADRIRAEKKAAQVAQGGTAWTLQKLMSTHLEEPQFFIGGALSEGLYGVIAPGKIGKALDATTPILTPGGFVPIGELVVGSTVFDRDGVPTKVAATRRFENRPCWRLKFDIGEEIVADDQHEWETREIYGESKIRTTAEIADSLFVRVDNGCLDEYRTNHSVRLIGLQVTTDAELTIPPYTLGAFLGDGTRGNGFITCCQKDEGIIEHIRTEGFEVRRQKANPDVFCALGLRAKLRDAGVLTTKRIPPIYWSASFDQRLELLRGLMDTDGHCTLANGRCEITLVDKDLAEDVLVLCRTLGIKATMREGEATLDGRFISKKYRIGFLTDLRVFHLERKAERQEKVKHERMNWIRIVSAERVEPRDTVCIEVDSASHQFLAGRGLIPTHNSFLMAGVSLALCQGSNALGHLPTQRCEVLYIDLEQNEARAKKRWKQVLCGDEPPEGLHIRFEWQRLDQGGTKMLEAFLDANSAVKVVVFDVFAKVKPTNPPKGMNAADQEYQILTWLKEIADRRRIAIVFIHHTNRNARAADILDTVSGTGAMSQCPDGLWFLTRKRGTKEGQLYITGRAPSEALYNLVWSPSIGTWTICGQEDS